MIYRATPKKTTRRKGKFTERWPGAIMAKCGGSVAHVFTPDEDVELLVNGDQVLDTRCPIDHSSMGLTFTEGAMEEDYDLTPLVEDSMLPAEEPERSYTDRVVIVMVVILLFMMASLFMLRVSGLI